MYTLGALVDVVLDYLIGQFEKLLDISEEETHHLHELLSLLFDCSAFFVRNDVKRAESDLAEEDDIQPSPAESAGGEDEIKKHVRKWSKYIKIVNILDSKLVVIVDTYTKGMPSRLMPRRVAGTEKILTFPKTAGLMPEFEPEELKAIIRALFADSPLRKSQLALIK